MFIKFILVYFLIGVIIDLIFRFIEMDFTSVDKVKNLWDVCAYIISYILVIMIWPILIGTGMVLYIKDHK